MKNHGKITILELCGNLSLGGIERAMQEFALGIDKEKFTVIVGTYDNSGPRKEILEKNGIKIIKVKNEQLLEIISKYHIDIVHSHNLDIKKYIGKTLNIQEVVFSGGYSENADINLIISKSLAYKIKLCKKINYEKDFVLYYPQNIESWNKHTLTRTHINSLRKRLGINKNDFVIGRLGRAEPSKTDFLLLASATRIAKKIPNVKFVFVGLPLLYRKILLAQPSLKGRVIFLPETPNDAEIARFYQIIDVFWHTASRGETFGNVNSEAMIFKKPVITHSTPFKGKLNETLDNAQIEIVDHMKTGMVANYPEDVANAALYLYENPLLAKTMGIKGFEKVKRLYNNKIIVKQFEKIVQNLITNKKIKITPSSKEIKIFFEKEYLFRSKNILDKTNTEQKYCYKIKKGIYKLIEWIYLLARHIIRKIFKVNIESREYYEKHYRILE